MVSWHNLHKFDVNIRPAPLTKVSIIFKLMANTTHKTDHKTLKQHALFTKQKIQWWKVYILQESKTNSLFLFNNFKKVSKV